MDTRVGVKKGFKAQSKSDLSACDWNSFDLIQSEIIDQAFVWIVKIWKN